jgi:hypothetical protein
LALDRKGETMSLFKVRYKGLSDIREMSKKDLAGVGVGVDGNLRWARPNDGVWGAHNVVFIENPSDELLEVFKNEGTFTVTEVQDSEDGPKEGQTVVQGSVLDDTGSVIRDTTTGAESNADGPKPGIAEGTKAGGTDATGDTGAGTSSGRAAKKTASSR